MKKLMTVAAVAALAPAQAFAQTAPTANAGLLDGVQTATDQVVGIVGTAGPTILAAYAAWAAFKWVRTMIKGI